MKHRDRPANSPVLSSDKECPVCAVPMVFVAEYDRWYCTRCGAFRRV